MESPRNPTPSHSNPDLKYIRARKVGQIRALEYVRGYVEKQLGIEEQELKDIESKLAKEIV